MENHTIYTSVCWFLHVNIIRAVQFLHRRGPIARALSYQILAAGTSVGSNYEESDGASSSADFLSKVRIALKEAKETSFDSKCVEGRDCWTPSSNRLFRSLTK